LQLAEHTNFHCFGLEDIHQFCCADRTDDRLTLDRLAT